MIQGFNPYRHNVTEHPRTAGRVFHNKWLGETNRPRKIVGLVHHVQDALQIRATRCLLSKLQLAVFKSLINDIHDLRRDLADVMFLFNLVTCGLKGSDYHTL
jgi:hypothetical protein